MELQLRDKMDKAWADFNRNADLLVAKHNKAAGARSRKATLELEKLFKEWRRITLRGGTGILPVNQGASNG